MSRQVFRRGRPDFFASAKTSVPIPARHPALRTYLVYASLDPEIRAIGHVATAHVEAVPVDLDAVVLTRDDGHRFHLDVVPARKIRAPGQEEIVRVALREIDLEPLVVTEADLETEPRRSNADLVWSHAGSFVPVEVRMRVLSLLSDEGPLPLGRMLEGVRSDHDPTAAVLSLACSDLIAIDLASTPLGPWTMVRARQ